MPLFPLTTLCPALELALFRPRPSIMQSKMSLEKGLYTEEAVGGAWLILVDPWELYVGR